MTLEILQVGWPVLRQRARPLTMDEIRSATIRQLIEQMRDTMRKAPGVGLAAPQIGQPLQMAVVEDREETRELMQLFLRPICHIETASTGSEALEMAGSRSYDVILMDLNLGPEIGGLDVIRKLRAMPAYEETPVAAVTAYAIEHERAECLDAGFTDYLTKPLNKQELLNLVHDLFARREALRGGSL